MILGGFVLGPLAIIFGGLGFKRANLGAGRRTMAKWDIGLGVVCIVSALVFVAMRKRHRGEVRRLSCHAGGGQGGRCPAA